MWCQNIDARTQNIDAWRWIRYYEYLRTSLITTRLHGTPGSAGPFSEKFLPLLAGVSDIRMPLMDGYQFIKSQGSKSWCESILYVSVS